MLPQQISVIILYMVHVQHHIIAGQAGHHWQVSEYRRFYGSRFHPWYYLDLWSGTLGTAQTVHVIIILQCWGTTHLWQVRYNHKQHHLLYCLWCLAITDFGYHSELCICWETTRRKKTRFWRESFDSFRFFAFVIVSRRWWLTTTWWRLFSGALINRFDRRLAIFSGVAHQGKSRSCETKKWIYH